MSFSFKQPPLSILKNPRFWGFFNIKMKINFRLRYVRNNQPKLSFYLWMLVITHAFQNMNRPLHPSFDFASVTVTRRHGHMANSVLRFFPGAPPPAPWNRHISYPWTAQYLQRSPVLFAFFALHLFLFGFLGMTPPSLSTKIYTNLLSSRWRN